MDDMRRERAKEAIMRKVDNAIKMMESMEAKGRLKGGKPLKSLREDIAGRISKYVDANYVEPKA